MNDRYLPLWVSMQTALLAAVILAGLLLASWQENELRFKFSLRTMLMFTTLSAAFLWLTLALIRLLSRI